jgi:hypothetical protein
MQFTAGMVCGLSGTSYERLTLSLYIIIGCTWPTLALRPVNDASSFSKLLVPPTDTKPGFCEIWCETSTEHPSPSQRSQTTSSKLLSCVCLHDRHTLPTLTASFVTTVPFSRKSINCCHLAQASRADASNAACLMDIPVSVCLLWPLQTGNLICNWQCG